MGKGAAGGMTGFGRGVTPPVSPPTARPMVTPNGVAALPPSQPAGMNTLQGPPGPVVSPVSPPPMNATGTANMGLGASAQTTVPPIQPDFTEMMGPGIWDQAKAYGAGMSGFSPAMELGNPNVVPPIGPNLPQNIPAPARGVGPKVRDFSAPNAMPPMPAPNPMPQSNAPRHTGAGGMPMPNPMRQQMKARSTNMLEPPSMPTPNPERGDFRALIDAGEGSPPPVSAPEVPQPVMGSTPIQGMFEPKAPIQPNRPTPLSEVPFSGKPVNEVGPNRLTPPVPAGPPGQAQPVSAPPQRPPVQNAALPVNEPLTPLSPAPIQTQRTPSSVHAAMAGAMPSNFAQINNDLVSNYGVNPKTAAFMVGMGNMEFQNVSPTNWHEHASSANPRHRGFLQQSSKNNGRGGFFDTSTKEAYVKNAKGWFEGGTSPNGKGAKFSQAKAEAYLDAQFAKKGYVDGNDWKQSYLAGGFDSIDFHPLRVKGAGDRISRATAMELYNQLKGN